MIWKKDYTKVHFDRVAPHLCVKWFHWSWRPRLYIHYWNDDLKEMRFIGIFKDKNNNYPGINSCEKKIHKDPSATELLVYMNPQIKK